jgi:hypothetical protein
MWEIIPENRKQQSPSFSQKLGNAVGVGLEGAQKLYNQHNLKKTQSQLTQLTGMDWSGISDPALLREGIHGVMQSKMAEQQSQSDESFWNKIFNGENKSNGSRVQSESSLQWPEEQEKSFSPLNITDEMIAKAGPKKGVVLRNLRSDARKEQNKTQASKPIDSEQLRIMQEVRSSPGFEDLDEVDQYRAMTNAGVSKENAEAESKLTNLQRTRQDQKIDKSYDAQKKFIDDTTKSYNGFETDMKPRLLQMRNIKDEDLVSPTAATFLEAVGIPLGALEDPSSELYHKLSQDLLKGLPETYGSRILKVEVDNFLKTIPTLLNSPDGRRMIASNMLKLGEMKEVYYNEMRKQQREILDSNKAFPKDFQQRVFDQVKPQIDRINNEFVQLSDIKSVPPGTIPFFSPAGDVKFVPKEHAQWAQEQGGKRIW